MVDSLPPDVVYEIDDNDIIAKVNEAWSTFAIENSGTLLLPPGIIGRSLWDFICDPTTRIVYSQLFSRVRSGAGASTFDFRCDSPVLKRFLQMEVAASGKGTLTFTVRTLRLEPRQSALILDPGAARSTDLVLVCSWCKRVSDGEGSWAEIEKAQALNVVFAEELPPQISHGMCDDCYTTMMQSLDEEPGADWSSHSTR